MLHALKTVQPYFDAVRKNEKNFELRKNDRPFKVGDEIVLQEYSEENGYTGEEQRRIISYILKDAKQYGLKDGFVILGLQEPTDTRNY